MPELSEDLKATIQEGYRSFLRYRDLKPRQGQRQMIGIIASTLGKVEVNEEGERDGDTPICVVEAGTGTGKTLGYLLPVLPVARAMGKQVVVATGTVSLQSQLMVKDIPELLAATGWKYSFALAKGRGRYLCNIRLELCLDAADASESGLFLFEDEKPFNSDKISGDFFKKLDESLTAGEWDGDRDAWPEFIDDSVWRALTVDRRQCTGHRCRKVNQCAFFRARAQLEDADCIIANHDLVMADLSLGGGAILPAPEQAIYIFDEAHRLGDTTLRHFAASCRLKATVQWLEQLEKGLAITAKTLAGDTGLVSQLDQIGSAAADALQSLRQATPLFSHILDEKLPANTSHFRFPLGDVGLEIRDLSAVLARGFIKLHSHLDDLSSSLEKKLDGFSPVPRVDLEQIHQGVGNWLARVEAVTGLWTQMAETDKPDQPPRARWLSPDELGQDVVVSVSPISAADLLRANLWYRAFGVVAASATIRALGRFDRFAATVGLPGHATTLAVPGAFDFANAAVLAIPDIGADASDASAHTQAVIDNLNSLVNREDASLVLFSSRRQMESVAAAISLELRDIVLMQGDYSHSEIVRRHKERIDGGDGSIIFGLASFAEGLDLPGNYCNHVIIAKLPFAVPDDPLQAAQAEWLESLGLKPFQAMTLPDTSLRLIQACGRLLRTESDTGRVTILDRRLVSKFYGRQLLDSLPPFRREID
ncbi:MAG: ATP-dependent DNA helicase DinG [Porticoccaceae bacterium]|nr:ATP-dependent DNA helicase DinG [Porticoccaceae bacterium]